MTNENDFFKKYRPLIKRLENVFGKDHIFPQAFNFGKEFAIAFEANGKRTAVSLEKITESTPIEYALVDQDDGTTEEQPVAWKHKHYSLNEMENKEEIIQGLIAKWGKFKANTENNPL